MVITNNALQKLNVKFRRDHIESRTTTFASKEGQHVYKHNDKPSKTRKIPRRGKRKTKAKKRQNDTDFEKEPAVLTEEGSQLMENRCVQNTKIITPLTGSALGAIMFMQAKMQLKRVNRSRTTILST